MPVDPFGDDKAGTTYWDAVWNTTPPPQPFDPNSTALSDVVEQRFARYFSELLRGRYPAGSRLLEIGCARSRWLPYFASEFGYEVVGLDYSERGAEQAEQVLAAARVHGTIRVGDLFDPQADLLESFDIVVSFGVVEHFRDYEGCIRHMARFLAPGGMMITEIPNMGGLVGKITRVLDRRVYDKHVVINRQELQTAHEAARLAVLRSEYFMWTNWAVINVGSWTNPRLKYWAWWCIDRVTKIFRLFERHVLQPSANSATSPYIVCAAQKPPGDRH